MKRFKRIKLTRGMHALVDEANYLRISKHKWRATLNKTFYAIRSKSRGKIILMHREILGLEAGDGIRVDHANGNTLDNRESNLRIATGSQNAVNSIRKNPPKSGYRGVYYNGRGRRWKAIIQSNGVRMHLGYFKTPFLAHLAFRAAHINHNGEFSVYNRGRKA